MANKHEIIIDKEKCVGCGLCEKDCVGFNIAVKDGKAEVKGGCIYCGHCEAICPKGAVTITGYEDEIREMKQVRLNPEELLNAIRTRRTIRQYQPRPVADNVVDDIIEAGRLAPTGTNSQNTGFIVLGSKQADLEAMAVQMFRNVTGLAKPLAAYLKDMKIDDNFFFKGAPLVIVLTGDKVNASLAAENMAFMAEAHGLGVLYSGFFTICTALNPKIHKELGMKLGEKAVTTMVMGYPAVNYQRTVHRNPANVRKL